MTPAKPTAFTFERAFDREAMGERPRTVQRKTLTLDEIETLKRDAYAAGLRAGETGQAKRAGDALLMIAGKIEQLSGALDAALQPARADAVSLAYVTALKLAKIALGKYPAEEIKVLIARCIEEQKAEPHLVLRVNDTLHDQVRAMAKELSEARAFGGRVHVIGEPQIPIGDCQIEWADGGLERNLSAALAQIEVIIRNYVVCADGAEDAVPSPEQIMKSEEGTQLSIEGV
jgi:flagellar assembly protein FliH